MQTKVFPRRIGVFLLGALLCVTTVLVLRALVRPAIGRTHTAFLFSQLEEQYRHSVGSGQQRATGTEQFLDRIPHWFIDGNSCSFRDRTIYDSWGSPAQIQVDSSQITLRSAGPDRRFETADDLSRQF